MIVKTRLVILALLILSLCPMANAMVRHQLQDFYQLTDSKVRKMARSIAIKVIELPLTKVRRFLLH